MKEAVARVDGFEDGEMRRVKVGDTDVLLVKLDGEFYALSPVCTHYGGPLQKGTLVGTRVRCPWHQAAFDIVTGELEEPPALDALSTFDVEVVDGDVVVDVPKDVDSSRVMEMSTYDSDVDDRTFVIVGAGAAGNAAAEKLRQVGFRGRVVIVTQEEDLPYDRPQLSKAYLSEVMNETPTLRSEEFYFDNDIEVITDVEVVKLDALSKTIEFVDGSTLNYNKALLATGGVPRELKLPGSDLDNIYTLRTAEDARQIVTKVEESSRALVVGASFIGMETAASMTEFGLDVTVVAPDSIPFEKTFGKDIGKMYREVHESNGVSFRLGSTVKRFEGDEKVQRVILDDGESLSTDLVIQGIGVEPATGYLEGVELNQDGSVSVDEKFRVAEDLYAAGDIARFTYRVTGEEVRIEHWRLAEQHGRLAAQNMVGKEKEFKSVPFFWTRQFGFSLQYVGYVSDWDDIIVRGDIPSRNFVAFYSKDGAIAAVAGCNNSLEMGTIAELIEMGDMPSVEEIQEGVDLTERLSKRQT